MRALAVTGVLLALLPFGASAQSTNCITTYLGSQAFTNCSSAQPTAPPPGYTLPRSYYDKIGCLLSVPPRSSCPAFTADDFTYVPIARPAQPPPAPAPAAPPWLVGPCSFKLGFKALHDAMPDAVGDCGENEHWNTSNGDSVQKTARGLLVWRKADNFTAFTDGYRSWVSGPNGVQQRLNTECFAWEAGCAF